MSHLYLVPARNDICVQNAWVHADCSIAMRCAVEVEHCILHIFGTICITNPLCLCFQISNMSRETLSENEISLLLSKNDDSGEEELIPCNDCTECAAAGDND